MGRLAGECAEHGGGVFVYFVGEMCGVIWDVE